mgnify:CR=1 FL=1
MGLFYRSTLTCSLLVGVADCCAVIRVSDYSRIHGIHGSREFGPLPWIPWFSANAVNCREFMRIFVDFRDFREKKTVSHDKKRKWRKFNINFSYIFLWKWRIKEVTMIACWQYLNPKGLHSPYEAFSVIKPHFCWIFWRREFAVNFA